MEEAGEFLDAAAQHDDAGMEEELGDLMMNVFLHGAIAEERGAFTLNDAARNVCEKMIRRHPHVFAEKTAENANEVLSLWDNIKKEEKQNSRKSILDGVPNHCPALLQAEKIQKKAAKVGFDWTQENQILDKIKEELNELNDAYAENNPDRVDEEIGDLLFAITNLSRFRNRASAEVLLGAANEKFKKRFQYIENTLAAREIPLEQAGIEMMEALWEESKKK